MYKVIKRFLVWIKDNQDINITLRVNCSIAGKRAKNAAIFHPKVV